MSRVSPSRSLNAPIGTTFGTRFFEDVARNTVFVPVNDSLISVVSLTIAIFSGKILSDKGY
jgi:hypothetical protein